MTEKVNPLRRHRSQNGVSSRPNPKSRSRSPLPPFPSPPAATLVGGRPRGKKVDGSSAVDAEQFGAVNDQFGVPKARSAGA
jgi:hypothetical protein